MLMRSLRPAAFALMLLLVACATTTDVPVAGEVTVELDAFSGLPNPIWALSANETGELERRLRDLPAARAARLPDLGLGYRGFRLTARPRGDGVVRPVYVTSGLVQVGGDDGPLYRDVHGVEAWLQAQARRQGYGGVFTRSDP